MPSDAGVLIQKILLLIKTYSINIKYNELNLYPHMFMIHFSKFHSKILINRTEKNEKKNEKMWPVLNYCKHFQPALSWKDKKESLVFSFSHLLFPGTIPNSSSISLASKWKIIYILKKVTCSPSLWWNLWPVCSNVKWTAMKS